MVNIHNYPKWNLHQQSFLVLESFCFAPFVYILAICNLTGEILFGRAFGSFTREQITVCMIARQVLHEKILFPSDNQN